MKGRISALCSYHHFCNGRGKWDICWCYEVVRWIESRLLNVQGFFILTFHHPHCQLVSITILL